MPPKLEPVCKKKPKRVKCQLKVTKSDNMDFYLGEGWNRKIGSAFLFPSERLTLKIQSATAQTGIDINASVLICWSSNPEITCNSEPLHNIKLTVNIIKFFSARTMTRSRIEFQGLFVRTEQTIETDVADVGLSLLFADCLPIPDNYDLYNLNCSDGLIWYIFYIVNISVSIFYNYSCTDGIKCKMDSSTVQLILPIHVSHMTTDSVLPFTSREGLNLKTS